MKLKIPMETNPSIRSVAVRWFEEVWNQRSIECIHELLAADAVGHMEAQDVVGPGQFELFHREILKAMPDFKMQIEDIVCEGENAVVRWKFQGTHAGEGLGCAPTQSQLGFGGMTWFKIRDGRIVEGWDRWNQGAFMQKMLNLA